MNIIWVNGCFDLLHLGHISLLKFAKSKGDLLYVGLDSDARVRERKGQNRPINNEMARFTILSSLIFVDKVFIYDTDYQLECLIEDFSPKMMVIGREYEGKRIIGQQFCETVTFFDIIDGLSTTNTINKILT
jgi:D-beta-D-heptose 7-phosphate kinase/D-beta-D-heptose 1-phosphate adenosyltransferase